MSQHPGSRLALGIDIGGTGIKGAPVDLATGELVGDRQRVRTPQPATPEAVADVAAGIAADAAGVSGECPVGITVPAVVQHGIARTAANIDPSWVDADLDALFTKRLGRPVHVVNDADAAGVAEARYGAAKDVPGLVVVTTLGTGIGSAFLLDGTLVPNTELGHLELDGAPAEHRAAQSAREREDLSWEAWAERLQRFYTHVERLFWPDLFVVGGGVSKRAERFLPLLELRTPIVAAQLRNSAGIVGAAWLAAQQGG